MIWRACGLEVGAWIVKNIASMAQNDEEYDGDKTSRKKRLLHCTKLIPRTAYHCACPADHLETQHNHVRGAVCCQNAQYIKGGCSSAGLMKPTTHE